MKPRTKISIISSASDIWTVRDKNAGLDRFGILQENDDGKDRDDDDGDQFDFPHEITPTSLFSACDGCRITTMPTPEVYTRARTRNTRTKGRIRPAVAWTVGASCKGGGQGFWFGSGSGWSCPPLWRPPAGPAALLLQLVDQLLLLVNQGLELGDLLFEGRRHAALPARLRGQTGDRLLGMLGGRGGLVPLSDQLIHLFLESHRGPAGPRSSSAFAVAISSAAVLRL